MKAMKKVKRLWKKENKKMSFKIFRELIVQSKRGERQQVGLYVDRRN